MVEIMTRAIVLDKEDLAESDSRVFLYTENLGKIIAKATSARKILSKLSAHLEPGNLIDIRLVNKNSFQIIDALKLDNLPKSSEMVRILHLVKELSPEGMADNSLWEFLLNSPLNGEKALGILGFDSAFALCDSCRAVHPQHFLLQELNYRCSSCFLKSGRPESFIIK